jgi:hypothetical protein
MSYCRCSTGSSFSARVLILLTKLEDSVKTDILFTKFLKSLFRTELTDTVTVAKSFLSLIEPT